MTRFFKVSFFIINLGLLVTAVYWMIRPFPSSMETEPFAGIRYIRIATRDPRPMMIHIMEIDLTHDGIEFAGTTGNLSLNPA